MATKAKTRVLYRHITDIERRQWKSFCRGCSAKWKKSGKYISAAFGASPDGTYEGSATCDGCGAPAEKVPSYLRKKNPASGAKKKNGLFDAPAVKRAKKVQAIPRVKDKENGELGTVVGVKGEWLKVKWDNRTKPGMVKPSAVRAVNGGKIGKGARIKRTVVKVVVNAAKVRPRKRRTTNGSAKPKVSRAAINKFEEFQGRGHSNITMDEVSSLAGKRKLYAIGPLKELKIKGVGVRKGARGSKLLADTKGKLWISEKIGTARPGSTGLVKIGEVEHVVYHARKPHVEADKWQDFIHHLGEETGHLPTLYIDPQGFGVLKGGRYTIEDRGIVN